MWKCFYTGEHRRGTQSRQLYLLAGVFFLLLFFFIQYTQGRAGEGGVGGVCSKFIWHTQLISRSAPDGRGGGSVLAIFPAAPPAWRSWVSPPARRPSRTARCPGGRSLILYPMKRPTMLLPNSQYILTFSLLTQHFQETIHVLKAWIQIRKSF